MSAESMRLVSLASAYLAQRRALGFGLHIAGRRLLAFARYADEHFPESGLTIAVAVAWARAANRPDPMTWARRLEIVRPFARYVRQFDPATEVPPAGLLGRAHRRLAPHVYTEKEIIALIREARRLSPARGLRPDTIATLIGLLAATGLHVSEALHLQRDDVEIDAALLQIRTTKFCKSRLVPLHATTVSALRQYAVRRDQACSSTTGSFFLVDGAIPLSYSKFRTAFRRLRIRLGWESRTNPTVRPRAHDLRHTFACRRLLQWHRDGVDVDAHLIDLSTYLGHAKVTDTYWYLSGFPELMDLVGQRFDKFVCAKTERRR